MTTYTIHKNLIIVTHDGSNHVISSDTDMMSVLHHLSFDFTYYYCSLRAGIGAPYFSASELIRSFKRLLATHDTQFIIDMLRYLLLMLPRLNYPEFRIIFVNEI